MKTIEKYIKESLLDDEDDLVDNNILYHPKDKFELIEVIISCLENKIYDLNCIDTSKITDMNHLFDSGPFYISYNPLKKYIAYFNKINISKWDVSNVEDMCGMFKYSNFNGDISNWNVSKVKDMSNMFSYSKFNGDISKWDVSNVKTMSCMFFGSIFNGDISKWDVRNVKNMSYMFKNSIFNKDISKWDVSNVIIYDKIFDNCEIEEKYKPKFNQI